VPLTLIHAGKYTTEDKLKIHSIQKLNATQTKQTTQNTAEQNDIGSVAYYDTRSKRGGLILQRESKKIPPLRFSKIFSQTVGNF